MPGYEMMFEKGRRLLLWSWAADRLSTAHNYIVATTRPDGRPHVMPVWGVLLDDEFYFSTGERSRKSHNLAVNPNCVVCPERLDDAVILEGVALKVTESRQLRRVINAYKKKYDWELDGSEGPIYVVHPRVVFGFSENAAAIQANPTRWLFG
jgi:nitroimidazol reductase NimA-like FMN-containing flavoprotein (pyridoxamine 5'-phosphate oxidase superfamily)